MKIPAIKRPAYSAAVFLFSSAVCRGASFIFTPLFTRVLDKGEFGLLSVYALWGAVLSVVLTFELFGGGFLRGYQRAENRAEYLSSNLGLCLSVCLVFSALGVLLLNPLARLSGLPPTWILLLFLQILGSVPLSFFGAKARFLCKPLAFSLFSVGGSLLPLFFSYFAIRGGADATSRIVFSSLISAMVGLICAILIFKEGKRFYIADVWRGSLRNAMPLLPHYFAYAGISECGRLLLSRFGGSADVASYAIVYSIGTATVMISAAVLSAFCPWMMRKLRSNNPLTVENMLGTLSVILCATSLLCALFSPELSSFLAPAGYGVSPSLSYLISLCPVPMFLSTVLIFKLFYDGRFYAVSAVSLTVFALSLGAHFAIVPRYFAVGCAFLAPVSFLLLTFAYALADRKSAVPLSLSYPVRVYVLFLLITVIFALLSPPLGARIFIGTLCLLTLGIRGFSALGELLEKKKLPT